MSGTSGKIALVDSFDGLAGNCPIVGGIVHVMDFVGYGSADCRRRIDDGAARRATRRRCSGWATATTDTDRNGIDFVDRRADAAPHRADRRARAAGARDRSAIERLNAPRDATIQITFTEPVDVVGAWFDITCAVERPAQQRDVRRRRPEPLHHAERQLRRRRAVHRHDLQGSGHDQDLDDSGPNTDTLPANYSWTFTVATGTAPPFPASVHLTMGNPTERDRRCRAAQQLPDGEAGVRAVVQPGPRPPELGQLAPVRRVDRHPDARRHVPRRSRGSARLVSRAVVRFPGQRLRSRPHGAQRRSRQGNVDPDQPGDVPDDEHDRAGAGQQPGPVGRRSRVTCERCCPPNEIYIVAGGVGAGGVGSNNGGVTTTLAERPRDRAGAHVEGRARDSEGRRRRHVARDLRVADHRRDHAEHPGHQERSVGELPDHGRCGREP